MNIKITLTDFVDFVLLSGRKKLNKVREIKGRKGYEPMTDYYKVIRDKIVYVLKNDKPITDIEKIIHTTSDVKKRGNFKSIYDGFKKFIGRKEIEFIEPPKDKFIYKELSMSLNPEIGLMIKGIPHVIKLYFKKDKIEKDKIHSIISLMESELKDDVEKDTEFAVLDINQSKLFYKDKRVLDYMPLIEGEAESFIKMWKTIK